MHTIIPVENVAYKIIFHTVDAFQIWNDQLVHPMGLVEKLLAILLVIIFQKCDYDKCHRQILRPSYLKIIFQCLSSLDHIQVWLRYKHYKDSSDILWL